MISKIYGVPSRLLKNDDTVGTSVLTSDILKHIKLDNKIGNGGC